MITLDKVIKLSSSNIDSVKYVSSDQSMEVQFKSGAIYSYADVPFNIFEQLVEAESAGKYFINNIKDNYECLRM